MFDNRDVAAPSLWDAAIPLSNAALHFAPVNIRNEWAELLKVSALVEAGEFAKTRIQKDTSWFDALGLMATGANNVLAPREKLLRHAEALLLNEIKENRALGMGFEPPRRIKSMPVHIPARYWRQSVSWDYCEVSYGALKFLDVRVLTSQMAKPFLQSFQATKQKTIEALPAPSGRPSFKVEILEAFAALQAEGRFNVKPLTHGIAQIRTWIKTNKPESRAAQGLLNDDTIRNAIKHLLADNDGAKIEKL